MPLYIHTENMFLRHGLKALAEKINQCRNTERREIHLVDVVYSQPSFWMRILGSGIILPEETALLSSATQADLFHPPAELLLDIDDDVTVLRRQLTRFLYSQPELRAHPPLIPAPLTAQENHITRLYLFGMSALEIAQYYNISNKTVYAALSNVREKMNVTYLTHFCLQSVIDCKMERADHQHYRRTRYQRKNTLTHRSK